MRGHNKPADGKVLAIATRRKRRGEKKIKDSASTTDTEGEQSIWTKHGNGTSGYKFI